MQTPPTSQGMRVYAQVGRVPSLFKTSHAEQGVAKHQAYSRSTSTSSTNCEPSADKPTGYGTLTFRFATFF